MAGRLAEALGRRWGIIMLGGACVILAALLTIVLWPRAVVPVPRITVSPTSGIVVGVPVTFDARDSFAGEQGRLSRSMTRYRWDFGDGSGQMDGERVQHIFEREGTYSVRLAAEVITGGRFAMADTVESVRVDALPAPRAAIAQPLQTKVRAGEPVQFSAVADLPDPLQKAISPEWLYRWDFGDGSSRPLGQDVSHAFAAPGTYIVVLDAVAKSAYGESETATVEQRIVVVPPPPDVEPIVVGRTGDLGEEGPRVVRAGRPVEFRVAQTQDVNGQPLEFRWDFDSDGIPDLITPQSAYPEPERVKYEKGFASPGQHVVTLKVWDSFAKEYNRPVTELIPVDVRGGGWPFAESGDGLAVSGGLVSLGPVSLYSASLGWSFADGGFSLLGGYAASTEAVDIDRTAQFPEVAAAGYSVVTHIGAATAWTLSGHMALAGPLTVSGIVGYLTLEGEHRASCRCLIAGKAPPVPFRENTMIAGIGVGLRVGFLVLSAHLFVDL